MKQKILVAIDGSEPALNALDQAVEIARKMELELHLVCVLPPILFPAPVSADVLAEVDRGNQKLAEGTLLSAKEMAEEHGVKAETEVVRGSPAETLADLAERADIWMVAVGSRGRGAVARMLLGSTADRLVHICKKPVLVVR